jgi:hypothetical protein
VKLKLTKCARAGNRAGFFHVRDFSCPVRTASVAGALPDVQRFTARLRTRVWFAAGGPALFTTTEKPMTFQPGQSGNPAGRPKGLRGKATILAEQLFELERRIAKLERAAQSAKGSQDGQTSPDRHDGA